MKRRVLTVLSELLLQSRKANLNLHVLEEALPLLLQRELCHS